MSQSLGRIPTHAVEGSEHSGRFRQERPSFHICALLTEVVNRLTPSSSVEWLERLPQGETKANDRQDDTAKEDGLGPEFPGGGK